MSEGEFVRFELEANGLNVGTPLLLFDANGEERRLSPAERLSIFSLQAQFESANKDKLLIIFDDGAVGQQNNIVDPGEATYFTMGVSGSGVGSAQANFPHPGIACGLGRSPTVISANGVGAVSVLVTGVGCITWG